MRGKDRDIFVFEDTMRQSYKINLLLKLPELVSNSLMVCYFNFDLNTTVLKYKLK